jgi:hypothetical protein
MPRLIMHIDLDAFYAAVEQRDRPEWHGLPLVVGAEPGKRGAVATCSYEARRYGVHSAMPISEAVRRLPPERPSTCARAWSATRGSRGKSWGCWKPSEYVRAAAKELPSPRQKRVSPHRFRHYSESRTMPSSA